MKALKNIFRFLTFVFGLAALVLFFVNGVQISSSKIGDIFASGAQLAFGTSVSNYQGTMSFNLNASSHLTFCFILTVITALCGGLNFSKMKNARYSNIVFGLFAGIYMLVIALANPMEKFIDYHRASPTITGVTAVKYTNNIILLIAVFLLASAVLGIVFTLIDDYLACKESKGKLTIPKKIAKFFREYKSEVKKIVWPGPREVVKNTVIVLIMCVLVGAFIWLVDFGLGKLITLILG